MAVDRRELKPNPDPTERTIEQSQLADTNLKELLSMQIKAVVRDLDEIRNTVKDFPSVMDAKIKTLREFFDEKFLGVDSQFTMRDIALAAAFKAAESAVKSQNESNTLAIDKAGTATSKQIDGLDEKIDDIKDRISELGKQNWASVGAYIVGAVGVVALLVTAMMRAH
jgi:hypothetical protein